MRKTVRVAECIDDYVTTVGGRLRGPVRLRADMLAEIRDALEDAAEAHRDGGADDREAERRAVSEFGSASVIAAGLQDVLAVAHGRRTVLAMLAVLGSHFAMSVWVGSTTDWRHYWGDAAPDRWYLWLAQATNIFVVVALVTSVAVVVSLGWGLRFLGIRRGLVRLAAVVTVVVLGVTALCGSLLTGLTPHPGAGGGTLLSVALWAIPSMIVLRSARECWRAASS
jgi:hypothetical protein